MKINHTFNSPRNIYEKLIRDSEALDIRINGDNMFNFLSTAFHIQEWLKKSPISDTEQGKRLLRKASKEDWMKVCKEVLNAKNTFAIEIDDSTLAEGEEPNFTKRPKVHDVVHYKKGTKTFKLLLGDVEYDPYELKSQIIDCYSGYFQTK